MCQIDCQYEQRTEKAISYERINLVPFFYLLTPTYTSGIPRGCAEIQPIKFKYGAC
jgi:hypothetical protein